MHGEIACTNEDLIRNAAYNWSPMSADEIVDKTGIEQRLYSRSTPRGARRSRPPARRWLTPVANPASSAAVLVATCTSTRTDPVGRDLDLR